MDTYSVTWMYSTMDEWQQEVLTTQGHMILLCGRQVGKSEIIAKKIADYLLNNSKKKLLIVSGVERQASGLYNKVLAYIQKDYPKMLKKGKDKPLRTHLKLINGSELITEPLGLDGSGARQHTLHGLICEEMQLISEEAYAAITPMLLTTGGFIWMLGTAYATEGYAYERLSDKNFKVIRVNAEEVAEMRPEPSRTIMKTFLEAERERLSEAFYMQEYLAIPSDRARQIFSDALIKRCLVLNRREGVSQGKAHVCGIDPAALGQDEGAITILDIDNDEDIQQVEYIKTEKKYTTEISDIIIQLDNRYDFKKIYVDDGGVGFGVFSELLHNGQTRSRIIPINNSRRPLDADDNQHTRIIKEELYINLLRLMERGHIKLLNIPEMRESLKSARYEYHEKTKRLIITSSYNHPVEALIRAAAHLIDKSLKLMVYSIKV